jgi:hypothetical protein
MRALRALIDRLRYKLGGAHLIAYQVPYPAHPKFKRVGYYVYRAPALPAAPIIGTPRI